MGRAVHCEMRDGSPITLYNADYPTFSGFNGMRMASLFVWLALGPLAAGKDKPTTVIRFFNDSAEAANFFVDNHFGCSVHANPEGNNDYCDVEANVGEHTVGAKGTKLGSQSCKVEVETPDNPGDAGAEAHLTKDNRFICLSIAHIY
jgi:hypothetical protein